MTSIFDTQAHRIRFAGQSWRAVATNVQYRRDTEYCVTVQMYPIPNQRSASVSEAWTGRKYQDVSAGYIYEVFGEPFERNDVSWVPAAWGAAPLKIVQTAEFESAHFTRIHEPKFAVGDKVNDGYDDYTIEAVSKSPDKNGNFGYTTRDERGDLDFTCHVDGWKKVSE